ncbi:SDR family NAD(P)-dependent oxidoreductase [Actinomadura rudentiformis]|uniref:SDR family oxidoreductase n=1 Tax=Actinomadura rudentiformis TaxID=359158 RepID=A0A6H9YM96_9ACTN|nr:SDR family oxidoreductase [Actinomadura rudentiformis]KAB2339686.1 SDR family oxidoreductase [Actinomadura rudentiformis]
MLLETKNAVIHGAGGAIGGAIARAFAREGAKVFLAGLSRARLDEVAHDIAAAGGKAEAAQVDALDEDAVERHAAEVKGRAGSIDICVNAVGIDIGNQGIPLVELSADDYAEPITAYTRTNFVTARATARHMMAAGAGTVLSLSPPMSRTPVALSGPFGIAGAAVEAMSRQLAAELGPHGVRFVGLRLNGIPETAEVLGSHTRQMWRRAAEKLNVPFEDLLESVGSGGHLKRPLTVAEVANVATFAASDRARYMTGTIINVTGGSSPD